MIKAVIFDLDNTLLDFIKMKQFAVQAAISSMVEAGLEVDEGEACKNIFRMYEEGGWENQSIFNDFLHHLQQDSISVIEDSLLLNTDYIFNRIKSEIARSVWGKDEAANIRLQLDNQVIESMKHFNEADAFLESLN